jgi:hypothetical protein
VKFGGSHTHEGLRDSPEAFMAFAHVRVRAIERWRSDDDAKRRRSRRPAEASALQPYA